MAEKLNIAVIAGGFSNERDISLLTAKQIADNLPSDKYQVKIIEITPERTWLLRHDLKEIASEEENNELAVINNHLDRLNVSENIDVAFLALHGKFGEDGRIQALLDYWQIPYTGSGVLASALGMNKLKCLEILSAHGILIPRNLILLSQPNDYSALKKQIKESLGYPLVVKPNESGSSVGISIVREENDLAAAVAKAFKEDKTVLIEEYLAGREITCAVMGNTGKTEITALPLVEIITGQAEFYDYQTKYFSNVAREECPANISPELTEKIQNIAKQVHTILGCEGLTRSDFILKDGQPYFLEINTIPGHTEMSLAPQAAKAIGLSFPEFLSKQIELALKK